MKCSFLVRNYKVCMCLHTMYFNLNVMLNYFLIKETAIRGSGCFKLQMRYNSYEIQTPDGPTTDVYETVSATKFVARSTEVR